MGLPPTTPPKLTDRRIKMDAQTRRRERRAEKQAQWKAANPLLVGVSAKPVIHNLNEDGFAPVLVKATPQEVNRG